VPLFTPAERAVSRIKGRHDGVLGVDRTDLCSSVGTSTASRGFDYNARLSRPQLFYNARLSRPQLFGRLRRFVDGRFTDPAMPRDSSLTIYDVRSRTLSVVCEACGRRKQFVVAKLVEEHGDRKLTDLLLRLANCPKTQTTNLHGRCGSVYEGLAIYETLLTS
jgi:hypothetical protein